VKIQGYISMGFKKAPHDMVRAVKYSKCGCGAHSMGKKQRTANKWQVRDGIRKIRRTMAFKHRWVAA